MPSPIRIAVGAIALAAALTPISASAQYRARMQPVPQIDSDRVAPTLESRERDAARCTQGHRNQIDTYQSQIQARNGQIQTLKQSADAIEKRSQKAEEDLPKRFLPQDPDGYEAAKTSLEGAFEQQLESIEARIAALAEEIDALRDRITAEEAAIQAC